MTPPPSKNNEDTQDVAHSGSSSGEHKTHRTHHKSTVSVIVGSDFNPVNGFVDFLREHAIVGLAIGFVIGTQVQSVVKQLVASFIFPLFQLFFGKALTSRSFTLTYSDRSAIFPWGAFVYGLLDFLFVVAAIYIIIKALKLDKLDKPPVVMTKTVVQKREEEEREKNRRREAREAEEDEEENL